MSIEKKPKFIKWYKKSSNAEIKAFVDTVYDELELGTLKVSAKKEVLITILMNLLESAKTGKGIWYSRNSNWYNKHPVRYGYYFRTYYFVRKVADALLEKGYIKQVKGFWDMKLNFRDPTKMHPSQKLLDYYKNVDLSVIENRLPPEEIQLRETTIVIVKNKRTGEETEREVDVMLDYQDNSNTEAMRAIVKEWNALRYKTLITIDAPIEVYQQDKSRERLEYYCNLEMEQDHVHLFVRPKGGYRVFRETFEKFGRYSATTETLLKKQYRPYFKINNAPTVELDFQAMHIRMLYNMENLDYQDDPYAIAATSYEDVKYRERGLFKGLGLMSINAKTEDGTVRALRDDLLEDEDNPRDIPHGDIAKMLDHWLVVHEPISKYLCTNIGLSLMYKDSQIAEKVIKHFTDRGIMILCIHDSFIIDRVHEAELKTVMSAAYQNIIKNEFNVKIDRKVA
ncbi:MAG: hypothetical protein NTY74_12140 [Ignavibacteriae bacterium]|nr:hypothetical protein [Ignavibacteriota bacterium]